MIMDDEDPKPPPEGSEGEGEEEIVETEPSEGGSEEEGLETQPGTEVPPPQESRLTRRVQQEIERRKAIENELDQMRRQNEEFRLHFQRSQMVDPAERQRRLDMMDPDEKHRFLMDEKERDWQARFGRLEYMMMSNNDQASFRHYLLENPDYRKYEDQVESLFNQAVRNGQPQSRNAILSWLIGEEARNTKKSALAKASKQGQENIRRATTRPIQGRSHVSGSGESRKMSAEERLRINLERGAYSDLF